MCGRYSLTDSKHLVGRFKADAKDVDLHNNFNVAPTQTMPVITEDESGRHVELMKWGIPRFVGKDTVKELINTRMESAFKPTWNKMMMTKRILVPATSFFEWKKSSEGKKPFVIQPNDKKLFAFAGIWNTWKDDSGKEWNVYSIITTVPNKEMAAIHDRMPVILHQDDESSWLSPSHNNDRGVIETLLRPYEDNGLYIYETSSDVNNVRNNYGELLLPINSQ